MPSIRAPHPLPDAPVDPAPPFSAVLRERSRHLHQRAEQSDFVSALLNGRVDRTGYVAMIAQHLCVYEALESVAETLRDDPVAGDFVSEQLTRVPSIRADLAHLTGSPSADGLAVLDSTRRYAERIRANEHWPAGFVAHHYTRYLGDLSGGLAIGAVLARVYGFAPGGDGVRFYRFERIPHPAAFKNDYRARLDAVPWSVAERDRVVDEVLVAYELNTEIFAELAGTYCPGG
ncbi:heme oxygenase [Haloactinopolyspora alba]|uniref:Heme oxygenase n=1 Tax=Haloactinopolyspora alba TaxID=648780 RepID=A0A2P8E7M6_9ACTN|nr:biliverdin-producing heme oxygenase [Haloactinopolyspora alba]PSL05428.1 heme oxygenase [Haloactinopolyspora alba]